MEEGLKKELDQFDNWVVILYKNGKGLSFDLKDEKSLALIPMLLASKDEFWDMTKKIVWDIKKQGK